MDFFATLNSFHIICGTIALVTFSVPLIAKKGSKTHVRAGWVYVLSMIGVVLSSLTISAYRFFFQDDATQNQIHNAVFLSMLSIFAASAVWTGLRVLKFKNRQGAHKNFRDIGFCVLRVVSAAVVIIYGLKVGHSLLTFFPIVLLLTGIQEIRYWLKPQESRWHWWFRHMNSMFFACISTVTAFVVTASPRLFPKLEFPGASLWYGTVGAMVAILLAMNFHYRRNFRIKTKS